MKEHKHRPILPGVLRFLGLWAGISGGYLTMGSTCPCCGRPGLNAGIIPDRIIAGLVDGNSIFSNLVASVSGALMYFATLTEIPILQGLLGSGMGKGPALALLLSGPALSLPSMVVIIKTIGLKKGLAYILLVVILYTIVGMLFGRLV